jgi:hypothetical protein
MCRLLFASLLGAFGATGLTGCGVAPPHPVVPAVSLDSDGSGGEEAYALVRKAFGYSSLECPDLFPDNHAGFPHIREDTDSEVGPHFVFLMHRDLDKDRDTCPGECDRQRNEIKGYDTSPEAMKGREGETMTVGWMMKVGEGMAVSHSWTHFFQLKAVGGDDGQPLVTLSAARRGSDDYLEVRHCSSSVYDVLARTPWAPVRGKWLRVECRAAFREEGSLRFMVTALDGTAVLKVEDNRLRMWRGNDFVRPKWGIYRGLKDREELRPDEETVRFAAFRITKEGR